MSKESKIFMDRNKIRSPFHITRKAYYEDHITNLPLEDLLDEYAAEVVQQELKQLFDKLMALSIERIAMTGLRFNGIEDQHIRDEFRSLGIEFEIPF